jgi:FecR-like protein
MARAFFALLLAALIAGALPARAAPGDDIGTSVRVVNLVTGEYEKDKRDLETGSSVRQDELIAVSDDGLGEIILNDDTALALGPGARLKLDQFVYDPDLDGGAIVVNLVRGAFRFITGVAAKPAYVIRTPTASITVRGTIFDVYVQDNGVSWLLLVEGAIEACNAFNDCADLIEPGKLIRITPDSGPFSPADWGQLASDDLPFETAFPFIVTPPQVDPNPVLTPVDVVGPGPDQGPGSEPVPDDDFDDDNVDDDDIIDEVDDDGPGPPPVLRCWNGWREVHRGWRREGWGVKRRRRGGQVVWCAVRVSDPGVDIPLPPKCIGGKTVLLKTLPPKWRCTCPSHKKRIRIGKGKYICKGKPGGGGPGLTPKEKCLKKGWKWFGGICIPKIKKCKPGYYGKWPNCKKKACKPGYVGKWPNCKKIIVDPPKKCPAGFFGKPPHCQPKKCKKGYVGKWPNCKKLGVKPIKKCKPGYVGKWPNCKKLGVKPIKKCKPGYVGKWPNCKKLFKPKPQKCPKGTIGKWPNCKKLSKPPKKVIDDFKKAFDKFKKNNN